MVELFCKPFIMEHPIGPLKCFFIPTQLNSVVFQHPVSNQLAQFLFMVLSLCFNLNPLLSFLKAVTQAMVSS